PNSHFQTVGFSIYRSATGVNHAAAVFKRRVLAFDPSEFRFSGGAVVNGTVGGSVITATLNVAGGFKQYASFPFGTSNNPISGELETRWSGAAVTLSNSIGEQTVAYNSASLSEVFYVIAEVLDVPTSVPFPVSDGGTILGPPGPNTGAIFIGASAHASLSGGVPMRVYIDISGELADQAP
ncbi:MAG: hypothetical protein Q8N51_17465, partial [Gammaproteobacteria bacterium]|nr:hypothetical protein [Gammaproteobacteria bacterium]